MCGPRGEAEMCFTIMGGDCGGEDGVGRWRLVTEPALCVIPRVCGSVEAVRGDCL